MTSTFGLNMHEHTQVHPLICKHPQHTYTFTCKVSFKKQEEFQSSNLILYLKELEKKEQSKPRARRKKMLRAKRNGMKTKLILKLNKTKSWFFEYINKTNKHYLDRLRRKKRKLQLLKPKVKVGTCYLFSRI